jgi:serine/threonine-protein kinase HipA
MNKCYGCYKIIKEGNYCHTCRRNLRLGTRFNGVLSFERKDFQEIRQKTLTSLSISGVQDKISLRLEKGELIPAQSNGEYILKPAPYTNDLNMADDIPVNEHLSMHLASEISGIECASHSLVRFADGPFAYLTLRFDRKSGRKRAQEDFCQLAGITEETHGRNFKYDYSYEEAAHLIQKFCAASVVETEKYFRLILFNYLIHNGDAHLKNFSLVQSEVGDYRLSPAYDLLCTAIHLPGDARTALDLFKEYESESLKINSYYTGSDFLDLADMLNLNPVRARRFITLLVTAAREKFPDAINASFLSDAAKDKYLDIVADRTRALERVQVAIGEFS